MTHPTPTVRVQPPIGQWTLAEQSAHDRAPLVERINRRARRLGTALLESPASRLIATGHQAQLWHPGILAKDIAIDLAAERLCAQRLHLTVDQDTNDTWRLEVPYRDGDELKVRSVLLADQKQNIPTGFQTPADPSQLRERLVSLDSPLTAVLSEALVNPPPCESLAEQVAVILARLRQPYAGDIPLMMVSDLAGLGLYESAVSRMFHDAHRCATVYNQAVAQFPGAGMTPLAVNRELAELPLWAVAWGQPRRRVFVDLSDAKPLFVYEDGEAIDTGAVKLLPRALLLTAVMRSCFCDLFIHGSGGLIYDQVTESWWRNWAGEELAPMAGATADVHLDLGAPVADRAELDRVVWRRHHLPHNLDRELGLDGDTVKQKRELIAHMGDDRDRARRREAFKKIHQINNKLAGQHADALEAAERDLRLAQIGVKNARIARRRDWCFALYPPDSLHALRRTLQGVAVQCGP
ncbi:MAG: hypothetical protein R3C45_17925 [Phycisphaerales bacterium]